MSVINKFVQMCAQNRGNIQQHPLFRNKRFPLEKCGLKFTISYVQRIHIIIAHGFSDSIHKRQQILNRFSRTHYVERKPLISEEWQAAAMSLSQSDMPIF